MDSDTAILSEVADDLDEQEPGSLAASGQPTGYGSLSAADPEHNWGASQSVAMQEMTSGGLSAKDHHKEPLTSHQTPEYNRSEASLSEEDKLFRYVEERLHHVEKELGRSSGEGTSENKGINAAYGTASELYVNMSDEEGSDDELEIHENHFGPEMGFTSVMDERRSNKLAGEKLHNLRHEVLTLIKHLESETTKLELLEQLTSGSPRRKQWYKHRLENCLEIIHDQMGNVQEKNDMLIDGVVDLGHDKFTESIVTKDIRKSPVIFETWIHGALFAIILVLIGAMYLWSRASDEWTVYLRLIRSPLLIVFLLYLYGINMKVWAMFKIDYVAIFNHSPSATPTPRYVFKVASTLTLLMAVLTVGVIIASAYTDRFPVVILPIFMWLTLFAFLLNPLDMFEKKIRFHLVITFVRVVISPFVFVYFTDFFLADQFNSSIVVFLDLEYLLCYTVFHGGQVDPGPGTCTTNKSGIRPVISALPALWRLLQCLRAFYDTHKIKHLVNAGKYFSTFPVVVFATLFSVYEKQNLPENFDLDDAGWILITWIIVSGIHGVYTFLWDVVMDWGLWGMCCRFRRKLVYGPKALYVLAIGVDLVMRCLWTLKLTLAIDWEVHSDLIFTGTVTITYPLALVALLRRKKACKPVIAHYYGS